MDENQSFMTLYDIPIVPQFEGLYYNASIESFEYQICSCLILKYKKNIKREVNEELSTYI